MLDSATIAEAVVREATLVAAYMRFDDPSISSTEQKLQKLLETSPLPESQELASVIEQVFWGSLLTEERRPTRIRLSLPTLDVEANTGGPAASIDFIRFSEQPSLTAASLRRLCQAYDPTSSFIGWGHGNGVPVLHGIGALRSRDHFPDFFTVRSFRPGMLDFTWVTMHLARFSNGQLDLLSESSVHSGVIREWADSVLEGTAIQLILPAATRSIADQGHGGSLWIANETVENFQCTIGYPTDPAEPLVERHPEAGMRRAYGHAIGMLAGTDGAVLLNANADLIGFGTFIELDQELSVERVLADGSTEIQSVSQTGGGRHRSAATFCARHVPSMAVVHSEDGAVSLIRHRVDRELCEIVRVSPLGFEFGGFIEGQ